MGTPFRLTVAAFVPTRAFWTSLWTWTVDVPTQPSVRYPSRIALFGSTSIWYSGAVAARSLFTLRRSGRVFSAAVTAVEAAATCAGSVPLTTTLIPLPPPNELCWATWICHESVWRLLRSAASFFCSALRSTLSSRRTTIVALFEAPPVKAAARAERPVSESPGTVVSMRLISG